jgi:hypothetical protein
MSMDTPAATPESNASLSVRDAASLFGAPGEPEQQAQPEANAEEAAPVETPKETPEATQADADPAKVDEATADPAKFTVKVDGKDVELTEAEIAEHYKNGLRQADYTRKTMEAAEQRKAAEAESTKAREERQKYAQGLQQAQTVLQAQLQEQSQIDWQKLLETDPVEYLKQQHLANQRQAKLQQIQQEQQQIHARNQQEQAAQMRAFLTAQQEELLAKLPEWKDDAKAKTEKSAISDYLKSQGFDEAQIAQITDHRAVILSRKAMLYDQMMSKAQAAAKKVNNLPQKVEKPGGGETNPTDGRTAAMKRLSQSGSLRDAAAVFSLLK